MATAISIPFVYMFWSLLTQFPVKNGRAVFAYGAGDNFSGLVVSGQTRETSITLPIGPERGGEIGWYITLVDANGTLLDHGQCSYFPASLLTVAPPEGLK